MRRGQPLERRTPLKAKQPARTLASADRMLGRIVSPATWRRKPEAPDPAPGNVYRIGVGNAKPLRRRPKKREPRVTEKLRWREALQPTCENPLCGSFGGRQRYRNQHHCIYAQHVRDAGGDVWDPRNSLTLCYDCHAKHHGGDRIPLSALHDSVFEFAVELLGTEPAYNYLRRRYRGSDSRLDALIL